MTGDPAGPVRMTALVEGRVQGVGFRVWVRGQAGRVGAQALATNLDDGRVEVVAVASRERCEQLLRLLHGGTTPGRVDEVDVRWDPPEAGAGEVP